MEAIEGAADIVEADPEPTGHIAEQFAVAGVHLSVDLKQGPLAEVGLKMDHSTQRQIDKLRSMCLVLGKDFEQLMEREIGVSPENTEYSGKVDLLVERMNDLMKFKTTEARSLANRIFEYWNILSVPIEERKDFTDLFYWIDSKPDDSVNEPDRLSSTAIGTMLDELGRVEGICRAKLSEKIMELQKYRKLVGLEDRNHATQQFGEDDEDEDVIKSLTSIKAQIKKIKVSHSSRVGIVTRAAIVLNAAYEVKWFRTYRYRVQALSDENHDMHERAVKAQHSSHNIVAMLQGLEVKVDAWTTAERKEFLYNGEDLIVIIQELIEDLSNMAPEVAMNLHVHQAPQPVMNPQPQHVEAQAEDIPHPPNPINMNVPRRVRTPRVLVEPQQPVPAQLAPVEPAEPAPVEPAEPAPVEPAEPAPAEPAPADLHMHQLSSGSSDDPDDSADPDYVP